MQIGTQTQIPVKTSTRALSLKRFCCGPLTYMRSAYDLLHNTATVPFFTTYVNRINNTIVYKHSCLDTKWRGEQVLRRAVGITVSLLIHIFYCFDTPIYNKKNTENRVICDCYIMLDIYYFGSTHEYLFLQTN